MPADYTYTILEFDSSRDFPTTGSVDTIYIDTERNLPFRWNGEYIQVSTTDSEIWGILGTVLASGGGGGVPYTGATANVDLGEYGITTGQVTLDTTPTGTAVVGTTQWNDSIGSSQTTLKGGTVLLKNGVDLVTRVVNKVNPAATLTRANYTAVRISGAQGQRLAIDYAKADSDLNSADTIGLVIEDIAANQEGFVMTVGQFIGVNTTGSLQGETWADGDVLYLSPTTAGRITNIKPTGATGHIVVIGYIEYAHAIHGKIYVKIMNGWELDELHNVYINSVANNDLLQYDSATQLWKNESLSAAGVQPTLVSGTNVKTINGSSVLGSGNISVQPTLTLTTTGTSGAATLVGDTLNIPQYSGGSGGGLQGAQIQFSNTQGQALFGFNAAINSATGGTVIPTASRLDVYPLTPNKTLTNVSLTITVATLGVGALARLVVYSDVNGFPTTKLYESTNIDCSTTGDKTVLTGLTFTAGTTYWLGFYSNGIATFRTLVTTSLLPIFSASTTTMTVAWSRINTALGTAPSTFNYNTYSSANQINIIVKQV
jgi:hypothetical protein